MARIDLGKVVGDSATIEVGSVTTLEAGQNATVENVGTSLNGIFNFGIPKGPKGDKGDTGSQGPVGPQGVQGKPFTIVKTYSSVLDMQADFNNMEVGDYVMIASNVESEDNARLYYRDTNEWKFISDFSGATGIQGEQGPQGQAGYTPVKGVDYFTSADIAEIEDDIKEITGELANLDTTDKTSLVSAINEVASSSGGSDVPIYILNTTNNLRDSNGTQSLGNDEKTRYGEIITDAYAKGYKRIAIMLCSTNSGKSYMFYSNNDIATNISPSFYADASFNDRSGMDYIVKRNLNGTGTWSNNEFTVTSTLIYDSERRLIVHSINSVAYTPTGDYNPATKKYVDDSIASAITTTLGGSY